MYVREDLPVEAILKGSAAKVLLHLMRRGGVMGTNAEMMRGSGVHDRNTYYVARAQLKDLGLLENPYGIIPQVLGKSQQGAGNNPAGDGKNPAPLMDNPAPITQPWQLGDSIHIPLRGNPAEAEVIPALTRDQEQQILAALRGQAPGAPIVNTDLPDSAAEAILPQSNGAGPRTFRAEAMEADLLPGGGEAHQRTSEFQLRRTRQIAVLQAAWREMFGADLTRESAKEVLVLTDNFAEDVLDAMDTAKARNVQSPRGYIIAMLRRRRAEGKQTVRPAAIGKPGTEAQPGSDDDAPGDDYYRPVSPEYRAKLEKLRRARPEMFSEEDD